MERKRDGLKINVIPKTQYLKRKSFIGFMNPYEVMQLNIEDKPKTEFDFDIEVKAQNEVNGIYEVIINTRLLSSLGNRNLYKLDISYGGLFEIKNSPKLNRDIKEEILYVHCPNLLFPYLRREVSTEIVEGGYMPLRFDFIDFKKMYDQMICAAKEALIKECN